MSAARVRPNDACAQHGLLILSGARRHTPRPYCGQVGRAAVVVPIPLPTTSHVSSISASLARVLAFCYRSHFFSFIITRYFSSFPLLQSLCLYYGYYCSVVVDDKLRRHRRCSVQYSSRQPCRFSGMIDIASCSLLFIRVSICLCGCSL